MYSIKCKNQLITFDQPKIMGILNLTPDSFFDGGKYKDLKSVLNQTEKMLADGADFIDIGAYSSKPNAETICLETEKQRLLPILEAIVTKFPEAIISIDTFRSQIADDCIQIGASIINDISAGEADELMFEVIAKNQVPYIMMHMRGNPQNMQSQTNYNNVVMDVMKYFSERIQIARQHQINDIIIDPGFGFAKTIEQNYEIVKHFDFFQNHNVPVLAGISRKSMIYKKFNTSPQEALNGTTILNTLLLEKKANILRVHDVKEAKECVLIRQMIY